MREKQGKEGMKKRKGGAGQRIREAKQRRVTLEHGTKEEAEEEGETFWKPRLHFQQRHIRFSFRRVSFGFVCSRWTGASTFLQFQQLWSDRWGGPEGRDRGRTLWPGPWAAPSPPGHCALPVPRRYSPGAPKARKAPESRPRGRRWVRAATGMGERAEAKTETKQKPKTAGGEEAEHTRWGDWGPAPALRAKLEVAGAQARAGLAWAPPPPAPARRPGSARSAPAASSARPRPRCPTRRPARAARPAPARERTSGEPRGAWRGGGAGRRPVGCDCQAF